MVKTNFRKEIRARRQKVRSRTLWVLGICAVVYLLIPMVLGNMSMLKYFRMIDTYDELIEEEKVLLEQNKSIEKDIRSFRSDPETIERVARERLGLIRPGETVYQILPVQSSNINE